MLLTSVLSSLLPGIICNAINYNRQQQQDLLKLPFPCQPQTKLIL